MSLVLEALRRVEKPDARTGSIGVAVASYRPARKRTGSAIPLLLGLVTGGAIVFQFALPQSGASGRSALSVEPAHAVLPQTRSVKGGAGLPPPLILEPVAQPGTVRRSPASSAYPDESPRVAAAASGPYGRGEEAPREARAHPSLVLQAISERDSHPIAIINDQLVKEGDKLGAVRVLRIGPDSVEVLLENGKKDTVSFAPPPPPEASPSPASS